MTLRSPSRARLRASTLMLLLLLHVLCGAAGGNAYDFPWQDPSIPTALRVANVVSLLSVAEKVALLSASSPAVPRIKLPGYEWAHECERGDTSSATGTAFPSGVALGSSFNATLVRAVAHATAIEVRANYDAAGDTGGTSCFGPVTNLIRDPRWGRVNEMLGGEDTTLASVLGVAFTRGIQAGAAATAAAGAAGTPCRMVNTIAKHLSAYSGPEGYGAGVRFGTQSRFSFAASMDERTWREFYLPPWRAMAVEGNVSGFMSSYMAVALDGAGAVPDTANAAFLTDTIRGAAWRNWSGYVLSDAGAVAFVGTVDWGGVDIGHGYARNASGAAAAALLAGTDIELTCCDLPAVYPTLAASVAAGSVPEAALDAALWRTLPVRFELGTLDPPGLCAYDNLTLANVSAPWMLALAVEAATQGVVLLKNDAGALPLRPATLAGRPLVVLGISANDTAANAGGYVNTHPPWFHTPLDGLAAAYGDVLYEPGCDTLACGAVDDAGVDAAVAGAGAVVVVLGTTVNGIVPGWVPSPTQNVMEGEGQDRVDVGLPGRQLQLLQRVVAAAAAAPAHPPVVLVVVNGGMLDVSWAAGDGGVAAILHAPFLGMATGDALAAVASGAANPAGRLTATWYTPAGLAAIGDITDYRMRPEGGYPGCTYRYTTAEVLYPFGYGLSYSAFSYSNLTISPRAPGPCDPVLVSVTLANASPVDGAEVVQLYLSLLEVSTPTPRRALVAFDRVWLPAGTATRVSLTLTPRLNAVMRAGDYVDVVEPRRVVYVGGDSAAAFSAGFATVGTVTPVAVCEA